MPEQAASPAAADHRKWLASDAAVGSLKGQFIMIQLAGLDDHAKLSRRHAAEIIRELAYWRRLAGLDRPPAEVGK